MTITVDFCRGSGGAFLAVNSIVVAGEANGDGTGHLIQSFDVDPSRILDALRPSPAPAAAPSDQPSEAAR